MLWEASRHVGAFAIAIALPSILQERGGVYCRAGRVIGSWWCLQVDGAVEEATWVRWVVVGMEDGKGEVIDAVFFC